MRACALCTVKRKLTKLRNVLRTDTDAQWHKHNLTNGLDTGKWTYVRGLPVLRSPYPAIPSRPNNARTRARGGRKREWACGGGGDGLSPPPTTRRARIDETDRSVGVHGAHHSAIARPPAGGLMLARFRAAAPRHNTSRVSTSNSKPFVRSRSMKLNIIIIYVCNVIIL